MNDSSVPEADGIKLLRGGEPGPLSGYSKPGDRPMRKKAFFRAWRRHELVAVVPSTAYQAICATAMFSAVYADTNCLDGHLYVTYPMDYGQKPDSSSD